MSPAGSLTIFEVERHRPWRLVDEHGVSACTGAEVGAQVAGVAQRGRHQQKTRIRQFQQRHLPGPTTVAVAVVVELVHHHQIDIQVRPLAQRPVGQNLGGADDYRGVSVDSRVTGHHAYIASTQLS